MEIFSYEMAANLEEKSKKQDWLIENIFRASSVGIIGGQPKSCKTWFALEMAVAIASGSPCLTQFKTKQPKSVLLFLAEDDLSIVKQRLTFLTFARNKYLHELKIFVITANSLRLDKSEHRAKLANTIKEINPSFLLLDPLVRMHEIDENSSQEVAKLLSFLRHLQRDFHLAIALVHHIRKNFSKNNLGQALRGSSDLHAWSDTNLFLTKNKDMITLSFEHRSDKPYMDISFKLDTTTYPKLMLQANQIDSSLDLQEQLIAYLHSVQKPVTRTVLRDALKIRNEKLGDLLTSLENNSKIIRSSQGWSLA